MLHCCLSHHSDYYQSLSFRVVTTSRHPYRPFSYPRIQTYCGWHYITPHVYDRDTSVNCRRVTSASIWSKSILNHPEKYFIGNCQLLTYLAAVREGCLSSPCKHNGLCRPFPDDGNQNFRCACPLGRNGKFCEQGGGILRILQFNPSTIWPIAACGQFFANNTFCPYINLSMSKML